MKGIFFVKKNLYLDMRKQALTLFTLLVITKIASACSCSPPNIFLEFYESKYVFYGEVISKTYPIDSLTYTFTIKVDKHFKKGEQPKNLSFTWRSEAYLRNGEFTSCDYDVNVGNKLLVFAQERNGIINFGLSCGNSHIGLSEFATKQLTFANQFNPSEYHFNYMFGSMFNETKPISDIDSLIKSYKAKNYGNIKEGVVIMLDVDTSGNVTKRNIWVNSNYELNKPNPQIHIFDIINKEYQKPKNEFEKDALDIVKEIKKWEVMKFKTNGKPVNSRQYISFSIDKDHKIKWRQSYFFLN